LVQKREAPLKKEGKFGDLNLSGKEGKKGNDKTEKCVGTPTPGKKRGDDTRQRKKRNNAAEGGPRKTNVQGPKGLTRTGKLAREKGNATPVKKRGGGSRSRRQESTGKKRHLQYYRGKLWKRKRRGPRN